MRAGAGNVLGLEVLDERVEPFLWKRCGKVAPGRLGGEAGYV